MSEIDVQNAKQIRDPMDVLITLSLADDDITMTYSGYSMAKVADGELDERNWPMRKLADLQGEGFPLDGSCVLYDSTVVPSQANGKLGVRGNVGETVTVVVTGSDTIPSIGIHVTGAESVTIGATTTPITSTNVTIPLLSSSATMVFNPAYEDRRIEISLIMPEADVRITNDNLIRATVSLRSDLSIIDPTLPESEINIEAYFDEDVSEAVAEIPEDTPIIYRAGYPGDMSPERKFYVTGQVTWANNVLTIQGVDAVHFLDKELFSNGWAVETDETSLTDVYQLVRYWTNYLVPGAKFRQDAFGYYGMDSLNSHDLIIPRGVSFRTALAEMMNLLRISDIDSRAYSSTGSAGPNFFLTYVDAGRPSLSYRKKTAGRTIKEEDCADHTKDIEPPIGRIVAEHQATTRLFGWNSGRNHRDYTVDYTEVGRGTWIKNSGIFVELDTLVKGFYVGIIHNNEMKLLCPSSPSPSLSDWIEIPEFFNFEGEELPWGLDGESMVGLLDSETKQGDALVDRNPYTPTYTQVIPWNIPYGEYGDFSRQSQAWNWLVSNGYIDRDATQTDVTLYGGKISIENEEIIKTNPGAESVRNETLTLNLAGSVVLCKDNNEYLGTAFPDMAIESLFSRSNKTGSFTWKGDPRMQPRDVVEWERLDGTTTVITLENITLTHEGGGTMAEITYREGVV